MVPGKKAARILFESRKAIASQLAAYAAKILGLFSVILDFLMMRHQARQRRLDDDDDDDSRQQE